MIRVVHPGSLIRILTYFLPIPAPGVKKAPDPGSATLNFCLLLIVGTFTQVFKLYLESHCRKE
jgi:hypothetical protein